LLLAAISPISAGSVANKTMRVTFSQPVRLPGVGLAPGTYIFEVPDPERAWEVVQVLSRDRSQVYFMGFTRIVNRPHSLPRDQVVSIGETQTGVPAPIDIWYPDGQSTGHQFIYSDRR
jgi:hypothetical protein